MTDDKTGQRRALYALLGDLPEREREIGAELVSRVEEPGYVLEQLVLDLNGIEAVPAYMALPKEHDGKLPVVLYNHAHGGDYVLGKDELVRGRQAVQAPPYAEALTSAGCAVLCIDHWAFGERRGRSESEIFKEMLWSGQVMWGMMVYDSLRALDYLCSRPEVDADRIATIGLSMGSTMAWWLAALDERVKVCIDLCCLTEFQALIDTRGLDGHGLYYYVPGLLKQFSTSSIKALISPRAHLSLAGRFDRLTPPAGLEEIDRELRQQYQRDGAPEAWQLRLYDCGHMETADMRARVMAFLEQWL